MPIRRRLFLSGVALSLLGRQGSASGISGRVVAVTGVGEVALDGGPFLPLSPGMVLPEGSAVRTRVDGLVELALDDGTRIHAGGDTKVTLQARGAGSDAAVTMVGLAVVDRRGASDGTALKVAGDGFDVELAGAQVFIASLRGHAQSDSVFVREGAASVSAEGAVLVLVAGEGVDLTPSLPSDALPDAGVAPEPEVPADGAAPPASAPPPAVPPSRPPVVARWSADRVSDAFASVGLTT